MIPSASTAVHPATDMVVRILQMESISMDMAVEDVSTVVPEALDMDAYIHLTGSTNTEFLTVFPCENSHM